MVVSTPALTSAIVTASVASRHVNNHTPPTVGAEIDITPFLFLFCLLICFAVGCFFPETEYEEKEDKELADLIKMQEAEVEKKRKEKEEELKRNWKEIEKEFGNACNQRFQR